MKKTLHIVSSLVASGVISDYALGGATALLFYSEPALTFDIDVFVFLPPSESASDLISLEPLYRKLEGEGFASEREHVIIEGIPVQFIPAYNPLIEEAVREAGVQDYEEEAVKVIGLEHLMAIMLETNRPKDRERLGQILESVSFDRGRFQKIITRHGLTKEWSLFLEKK